MRRVLSNLFVVLGCRFVLAVLFMWAAVPKIMDPNAFATAIDNYHFLPHVLVNLWGIVLPWVELTVGVILLLGPASDPPYDSVTEAAALVSALMYLSFVIALAAALARGLDIDCGCFNQGGNGVINWTYLVRDSSLLAASLVVFAFHRRLAKTSP
jgi:uncharacterized membrane protein YphA (DoxX/SURF4 family)